ncbi:MAG: cell division protein FtsH, partial [Patescibacteria group bacterium]
LVFLGRDFGAQKNYSEQMAKTVDAEVSNFLRDAFHRAEKVLKKYRKALDAVAKRLIETESIEREEFEGILGSFGLKQATS